MLAGELADAGKVDDGLAMAKGLLKNDNSDEDRKVWLDLGQVDTRLHRWKDAEDALQQGRSSLTTKKEDRVYLLFLNGALAERQKHYEPAEQFFRQALDLDPSNAMALNYLGYMLADKGTRLPEALKLIRKAVEHGADERRLSRFAGLGLLQARASTNWPRRTCARPSSATRPTPPSTTTLAICTRRPAASAWPRRSGSSP